MIRTDNYIRALSDKGLVDDAMLLENGYDIQYKGNIVSVRLNDKGGAVIFNKKKSKKCYLFNEKFLTKCNMLYLLYEICLYLRKNRLDF